MTAFNEFWSLYPHKVGKKKAEQKYWIARRDTAHEVIMEGLKRYIETKPDWKPWCNPETWLNQGRWDDEPASSEVAKPEPGEHTPRPTPTYLQTKRPERVRLTPDEKAKRKARDAVFAAMRAEGIDPYQAPIEEVRKRIADRLRLSQDTANA